MSILIGFVRILALLILASTAARAADWPNFRGPAHDGTSMEKGWQRAWPSDPPTAWRAQVGLGFSSIVVAHGRAATAGHASAQDTIFCFDAVHGQTLWKYSYPSELGDKFYEG